MPEKIVIEMPAAPTGAAAETLVLDLGNLAALDPVRNESRGDVCGSIKQIDSPKRKYLDGY